MTASSTLYPTQQGVTPQVPAAQESALSSLFSKALNLLKSQTTTVSAGTSFLLTRIPPAPRFAVDPTVSPPPPYTSSASLPLKSPSSSSSSSASATAESPTTPTATSYTNTPSRSIPPTTVQPSPGAQRTSVLSGYHQQTSISSASLQAPLPPPLLTFTDTTPYLTVHASQGILEVREDELRMTGVDKAFWVCVGLVYWGYMADREGWVWAGEE
ncbi:hypothetical protein H1R20_g4225, partial [Candolleomyces eurysporus]